MQLLLLVIMSLLVALAMATTMTASLRIAPAVVSKPLWGPATATVVSATPYDWLFNTTVDFLKRCQLTGVGGVQLFTPDASSSYGAQWTRDFTMAVINAPLALEATSTNISAAVAYTLDRVTADGMVPDKCLSNGSAVFAPGGPGAWPIKLSWDNMPYAGLLLAAYASHWEDASFFCKYEPVARRALDLLGMTQGSTHFYARLAHYCTAATVFSPYH